MDLPTHYFNVSGLYVNIGVKLFVIVNEYKSSFIVLKRFV